SALGRPKRKGLQLDFAFVFVVLGFSIDPFNLQKIINSSHLILLFYDLFMPLLCPGASTGRNSRRRHRDRRDIQAEILVYLPPAFTEGSFVTNRNETVRPSNWKCGRR